MDLPVWVTEERDLLVATRRYLHKHPEVSMQEFETCCYIEAMLNNLGIAHRRVGETGVFAWIDGKKQGENRVVALRADIDALAMDDLKQVPYASRHQGVCHACGHDGHTAALLTAAHILKEREATFSGQIKLLFQQGEEYGQGARLFVQEGILDDCDRVFGIHVSSKLDVGKVSLTKGPQCASCDHFSIEITGKGAHVSTPHLGIDAAYIGAQVLVGLQSVVARSTDPLETVVVGVGKFTAGTQYNIVADKAVLEGTTRSFLPMIRKATNEQVTRIAKGTAELYGANASVQFTNYAAPLINDDIATEEVTQTAKEFLSDEAIVTDFERALGADDFADYLAVTKGCYAFVGTRNPNFADTARALHHGLVDLDEEGLLLGCALYVKTALDWLA